MTRQHNCDASLTDFYSYRPDGLSQKNLSSEDLRLRVLLTTTREIERALSERAICTVMERCPKDIIRLILLNLADKELTRTERACSVFRNITKADSFWGRNVARQRKQIRALERKSRERQKRNLGGGRGLRIALPNPKSPDSGSIATTTRSFTLENGRMGDCTAMALWETHHF